VLVVAATSSALLLRIRWRSEEEAVDSMRVRTMVVVGRRESFMADG
jgi:hypothetical protein